MSAVSVPSPVSAAPAQLYRRLVAAGVASADSPCGVAAAIAADRRADARLDFEYRLLMTPVRKDGSIIERADGESVVWGRDLSERGIGFTHTQPLPHRRVLLCAADPRLAALGLDGLELTVVLKWCRFLGPGRYESGGRFPRVLA
ncbi:MAG: hypothetical protein ACRCT8_13375 [Lacipirellulaceae bacterium]